MEEKRDLRFYRTGRLERTRVVVVRGDFHREYTPSFERLSKVRLFARGKLGKPEVFVGPHFLEVVYRV